MEIYHDRLLTGAPRRRAADAFHPAVGFAYFASVITAAMLLMHPLYIAAGLLFAALAGMIYCGAKAVARTVLLGLPLALFITAVNPLISQGGVTPLLMLGGTAVTLEALIYGACSGGVLMLMFLWFRGYNRVVTPERFLYLFSRVAPAAALLVTMTQRMVGLFTHRAARIAAAQKTLLCDATQGSAAARFKSGLRITSVLLGWSMEEGLDTADSMKARGYGAGKRSTYSIYRFRPADGVALALIVACLCVCLAGYYASPRFMFYPMLRLPAATPLSIAAFAAFVALAALPALTELAEVIVWR